MDSTLACLAAWMPRQRWYAAKGRPPSLRLVSWWDLPPADENDSDARIRTFLVADEGALPTVLYQIPVVARATESLDAASEHIIGSPEPGTTLIDGPFDPAYTRALIRLVTVGGAGRGPRTVATGHTTAIVAANELRTASVLTGEQSNTSLIYRGSGMPIICKLYRQLHAGLNPDIELPTALADAGSPHVPRAVGRIDGEWPDLSTAHGVATGSLATAQEFLPDVQDAWRVALRAAADSQDFRDEARTLGVATADVHLALAELFPTRAIQDVDRVEIAAIWRRRLTIAIAEAPAIVEHLAAIEDVYEHAVGIAWPSLQRIHGDYHLGQALRVPARGWVLLDFEGEPMRPMAERTRPDLALRDVAGMLRSFDYVAGSIRLDHPNRSRESVRDWVRDTRHAFVAGYEERSGADLASLRPLLVALELDKAVYEAVYEARNRPTWLAIPLRAISRLVERSASVA